MSSLVDMRGYSFHVGCKVVRAVSDTRLEICTVTRLDEKGLFLSGSKIPIRFPQRLIILEQDPLYKMIKDYKNND